MTPHINAKEGKIAKTVLMPGDPKRAKYIAENYLENYELVSDVRGILAYTGFYEGKKVTIMASGMGNPSMGIYSYELYKYYDVLTIMKTKKPVLSLISKNIGLDKYNLEANKLGSVSLNEQEYNMLLDFLNK